MREFYVFKIGKKEDTSKARKTWGDGGGRAQPAPRRVFDRELRAAPRNEFDGAEQASVGDDIGYGYYLQSLDRKDMDMAFSTEQAAERYAKEQAELQPKTLFGVFSCVKVFETTTPSVIEKQYNDAGELLVVTK